MRSWKPSAPSEMSPESRKILSLLGMARRAGAISVGQDQVLGKLGRSKFLVIVASDCAANVIRKLAASSARGESVCYMLEDASREDIGSALGIIKAQIVAIPIQSGFVNKLTELLQQGGRYLNEQNEGV